MEHSDDRVTAALGIAVGTQMLLGVDGVQLGRGGQIPRRIAGDRLAGPRIAAEQAARLVGQADEAVGHHLIVD
jgi:hypothetical protein